MGLNECAMRHSKPKPMQMRRAGLHPIITIKNTLKVNTVFLYLRSKKSDVGKVVFIVKFGKRRSCVSQTF